MLQFVTSISELNMGQLLYVHKQSIYTSCDDRERHSSGFSEALQAEQDFFDYIHDFFRRHNGIYALWVVNGRCCSALRLEPYSGGLLLSGLETAQEVRGNGYATALVRSVLEHLKTTDYKKVYSHVDKNNRPSLRVHNNCGFHRVLEHAVYVDGSVYHSSCTFSYAL